MDTLERIYSAINTKKKNPILWTLNGVGVDLFGCFSIEGMGDLEFKVHCICIVFIPVMPVGVYLVEVRELDPIEGTTFGIHGKISLLKFFRLFGFTSVVILALSVLLESIGKILILLIILALSYGIALLFGQV